MAKNKNFSVIINELFSSASKAITEKYINKEISSSNIARLKNVYSVLLDKNFKTSDEFIKSMNSVYPAQKNNFLIRLFQQIYFFISTKSTTTQEIDHQTDHIVNLINEIPSKSPLYKVKSNLKSAVTKMCKLKKMHVSSLQSSASVPTISGKIIDFTEANGKIDQINQFIALQAELKNTLNSNQNKMISKFLTDLSSSISAYIDQQKIETNNAEENKRYSDSIIYFISQIDILKSQLPNNKFSSEIKSLNKVCKLLNYSLLSNYEKAKYNEENRLRKAYSPKSFKKFLDLHIKAIEYANAIISRALCEDKIDFNIIKPFQEMVDILDPHLYDEKFFSSNLKKLVSVVKKEIQNKQKTTKIYNLTYKFCYNLALDNNPNAWKKIASQVTVKDSSTGATIKAQISSTPANEFGAFTHLTSGTGLTSNHRDSQHAINMWKSEISSGDNVLFSAIRHGNTRGKKDASIDIILAAAIQQYGLQALQNSPNGKTWEVKFSNVQLMSPMNILPSKTDGKMPLDQLNTFNDLAGKTVSIEIKTQTQDTKKINLKLLKPVLFNFGVNELHFMFKRTFAISTYNENKKALEALFGTEKVQRIEDKFKFTLTAKNLKEKIKSLSSKNIIIENVILGPGDGQVGKCINELEKSLVKPNVSEENKKYTKLKITKIKNLSSQILDLFFRTKGRGIAKNPSAIPTRVSLLMFLIGYPITFNCKSGKDRTGAVAADINNLALYMETHNGAAPDPYGRLSDEEIEQATKVFNETKPDKIAQANLGIRGLKIGFKGFTKRQGKMKGASKYGKF